MTLYFNYLLNSMITQRIKEMEIILIRLRIEMMVT